MKKVFIFFIFSFLQQVVAQQIPAEYQLSPAGLLETNFDHYGTSYPLVNLQIGATTNYTVVQAGIFDIYYATNSGMEGTSTANSQKRNVINKVFSDLSDFLDTPLKTIPNAPKIKIWIQNFTAVQSHAYNDIAYGTSFYNVPKNMGTAAIADNQLWQMINSGKDPYHKVTFSVDDSNQPLSFFHAAFAFNPALNWNTSLGYAPYANQYDLYTFALREAVHALGVNSLIAQNGTSRFGANYNYYSRFDTFLKNKNNVALIANTQGCSFNSGYGFNGNLSDLGTNCNNNNNASPCGKTNYFAGTNTLKLVTPNCYNPLVTSLFVNTNCNENLDNNWLLDRALRKGDMQRYLNPYERQLLVDLGYGFARTFGKNSRLNHINYNRTATSHAVVGVNDGFDTLGAMRYAATNQPLAVVNLLANDKNATNFECLQDLTDATAVFSATTGTASTSSMFTTAVAGNHLLSYIPYNANTGKRGNRTYVYVYLVNLCAAPPTDCNLVYNGDFEQYLTLPTQLHQIERACNWYSAGGSGGPTYRHRHATPIGIINQSILVPGNPAGSPQEVNPTYGGDAYALVELFRYNDPNDPKNTGKQNLLATELVQPLLANTSYRLQFDVSRTEYSTNAMAIQAYLGFNPISGNIPGDQGNYILEPNSILLDNSINNGNTFTTNTTGWDTITFNFTTGNTAGQSFLFLCGYNNISYMFPYTLVSKTGYYIDNVKLIPIYNPLLNIQPESLCITAPSLDLSTMLTGGVTGGVFSGPGVTGTTFNPATAGVGTHTITYTIPNPIACPAIVVTDTITVNSCLPAQKPYISQVYYNGADKFVEIKNKDNTTAIATGMYYLALYENGATTGAPTSFVDLGAIPANGVTVFRANATANPSYAVASATIMPLLENYDGTTDILLITTSTGTNAYNDRIDIIGDNTTHAVFAKDYTQETYASLVRVSCTPMGFPRTDYDEQDWVGFSDTEVVVDTNKKNSILGRHYNDLLTFEASYTWDDLSIDNSNPDRSREIALNQNYNTTTYGSFEACSLQLTTGVTLTITATNYVKVQTSVDVTAMGSNLIIEDKGALIMARDCYYPSVPCENAGLSLVNLGANSTMQETKQTVAIDSPYDYVYLSSPLAAHPLSKKAGELFTFGSGLGQFNPSRFYLFENKNFCNVINTYSPLKTLDSYDDNLNDYMPINQIPNALNEHLIPGRGYVTWPPVAPSGTTNFQYAITFNGLMNNGIIKVPVYKNNSQLGINSNLVGNPYPSAIDLDKFFDANQGKILPAAYIWSRIAPDDGDPTTLNEGPYGLDYGPGNFSVYYSGINASTPYHVLLNPDGNGAFGGGKVIASGQAFFVNTPKDFTNFTQPVLNPVQNHTPLYGAYGYAVKHPQEEIVVSDTIVFKNLMRTTMPNTTFSKMAQNRVASQEGLDKIILKLTDNLQYNVLAAVLFKQDGEATFNQMEDVETMGGRKYNLYTQSTPKDLIIDVQNGFTTDKIIPLGILNNSNTLNANLQLSIDALSGIFTTQNVYVLDTLTNSVHNLSQGAYLFATNGSIIENRLYLLFTDVLPTFERKNNLERSGQNIYKRRYATH